MTKVKFIKSAISVGLAYAENSVAELHDVLAQSLFDSGFVEILEQAKEVRQAVQENPEVKKATKNKRGKL
jgi:ubiquinone biosynthesis protein Coq4